MAAGEPGAVGPGALPRWVGPGLAGLLSLLIFLSLPLIPLLGPLTAVLTPLPLVHLLAVSGGSVLGWAWVLLCLAGLALLTGWAGALWATVGYLLVGAWPAWAVELWARRRWPTGRWLALVAGVALAVLVAVLVGFFHPEPPAAGVERLLTPTAAESAGLAKRLGVRRWAGEELAGAALRGVAALAPALGALYVAATALWLRPRLPLFGLPVGREPFAAYASEEWLPAAFAVAGLGWAFAPGLFKWFFLNFLVVVLGLFFVHGLAIIHHYLGRRLASRRLVRLAVGLLALQMPLALAVAGAGLADCFVPLRRGGGQGEEGER